MLWEETTARFESRGNATERPEELAEIGEMIVRGPKRTTRRLWMSTLWGRKKGKLEPLHDMLYRSKVEALQMGSGPPLRAEVSWEDEELRDAQKFAKSGMQPKGARP